MKKNLSAEEIAVALLELGEDATVERIEELQACMSESALWEGADRASAVRVVVERVCDLLEHEPVDGGAALFRDRQRALEHGRLFQSGEFSDLALRDLPDLEKHRGTRIGVKAFAVAHNVKYDTDELLFMVTQPDVLDGSTFFARALTALSPRPPGAREVGLALDVPGGIELPSPGVVIDTGANGGAAITSDFHGEDELPGVTAALCAVEAMILAHAFAGIDVRSAAYVKGVGTALDAIGKHVDGPEVSRGLEM
ncbi:hypothetical protein [Burkholderia pseudomallei]|uniref:hypothetical protein n=1 Tax=Burkholderia pseudomallei TaxID=28450 RepID=UPI000A1A28C6|nr:hypothetical protein [Burkholderia pseudomallei]ARL04390.1 hypothetical protein BOC44_21750 [Burkholderia pseudomallei]